MSSNIVLYDNSGKKLAVGARLGEGGEGSVYDVQNEPGLVAKLYHRPLSKEKSQKIIFMINLATPELVKVSAWPQRLLKNADGDYTGLLISKLDSRQYRQIHDLTGPKTRLQHFPTADWHFLIHTARNLSTAFAIIHESGQVIGDVNQNNIFVDQKGTVKFIDIDSIQITTPTTLYLCEVGVTEFTSPELQSKNLKILTRNPNHDNFGLATLIFQLIFIGRWPYVGIGAADEMAEAIARHQFVFGHHAIQKGLRPPPNTLPTTSVPSYIMDLFERAFVGQSTRPTGIEWKKALEQLIAEIATCTVNSGHKYYKHSSCPWCEIEARTSFQISFFNAGYSGVAPKIVITNNIDGLWDRIIKIESPDLIEMSEPAQSVAAESYVDKERKQTVKYNVQGFIVTIFIFLIYLYTPLSFWFSVVLAISNWILHKSLIGKTSNSILKQRLQSLDLPVNTAYQSIHRNSVKTKQQYDEKMTELSKARHDFQNLSKREQNLLNELKSKAQRLQLEAHLKAVSVSNSQIPGIGFSLIATLRSYGINSANDIEYYDLQGVPGFGKKRIQDLMNWRKELERGFKFDPSRGVPQSAVDGVLRQIEGERRQLQSKLQNGPLELHNIVQVGISQEKQLTQQLEYLVGNRELEMRRLLA